MTFLKPRRFWLAGFVCWMVVLMVSSTMAAQQATKPRVLVYTRNYTPDGKGYVHDNIATSVAAIEKMGAEAGFAVDVSDDPAVFTTGNLKKYAALVFSNSNNEAFSTDAQRDAFKKFIEAGGGFVGIHSASGSEREWPYFWQVLGGKFVKHPKMQTFTVRVTDATFAAMKGVPKEFTWTDECYFLDHLNADIHPVLVTARTKLQYLDAMHIDVATFAKDLPLAWYHHFDGGREFYIALGHNKEDYANAMFYGILKRGILWAVDKSS